MPTQTPAGYPVLRTKKYFGKRHLVLECRCLVPARSSDHRLSFAARLLLFVLHADFHWRRSSWHFLNRESTKEPKLTSTAGSSARATKEHRKGASEAAARIARMIHVESNCLGAA